MSDAKKKILGLFRSVTSGGKNDRESDKERERQRDKERDRDRGRDKDRARRRERHSTSHRSSRSRSTQHSSTQRSRRSSTIPAPLTSWPPPGYPQDRHISQGKAMELIARGTPVFKGWRRSIPHASEEYYALYGGAEGSASVGSDGRKVWNEAFRKRSFRLGGAEPWDTLEQPSCEFWEGRGGGTVTLCAWVSLSGNPHPPLELRDLGVKPREVALSTILERLIYLESGFEEDYEDLMYKNLYKNLLKDPDKYTNPHKAMEKQIADLIIVLSKPEWIDFSKPENQVVAKFFSNATYTDHGRYKAFFHQLLLSMELDLRIHSKHHADWAKKKLLEQVPPSIAWNLALARRWRECMTIQKFRTDVDPQQIKFHLKVKKSQVKALLKFARAMKWPNLGPVTEILRETSPEDKTLEERSSDTMSYFTGMILPGATLPWLLMNSLIDCDADASTLAALTHMYPHSGFQYKSTTYWSATSIVGKVLAPTCNDIGGWIGPARPAPDLSRVQIARIRQRRPKQDLTINDVESMTVRSDPLGPPSDSYPMAEYHLPIADPDDIVDTVRIEKLALKPIPPTSPLSPISAEANKPLTYDAAVQFAIAGRSWPLRLSYDVSFVSSFPCAYGPHPLFFDYVYKALPVDEILDVKDWGGLNTNNNNNISGGSPSSPGASALSEEREDDQREKVLVIEAFGVADNEVLARAWCSHWGLSAIIADVGVTCMACAIREAYAACLTVVVMVDSSSYDEEHEREH